MKPQRVLQVATIMNRGGLETMLINYMRRIDRERVQFDFLVHREERGHYDDEIESLGGRIFRMPAIQPGHYGAYFRKLESFFREHPEYRVVHAHINENSGFVLRAAKLAGVPCRIAHSHLSDLGLDFKLPFRLYARQALKGQPNYYFACSENAGRWLFGRGKPVHVMNNAVNVEEFRFDPDARGTVRAELEGDGRLVVGHIGRFNKQKNHEGLLDIFAALRERRPDALLVMAGDGPLRPAMERKAERLGLAGHVRFLGVRSDIPRLLQAFDLFLFPSLFEGLPVVLVEAQAAGLPCFVSDTITREADATGRVTFIGLKTSPAAWASRILSAALTRQDASAQLAARGYDAGRMAAWLADFYTGQAMAAQESDAGGRRA
ncbi:glycosyltransferase family 1 protein [Paenibacillus aurantiacus]|uniref:Glycosyltransferase family 1 protein n=1 Tax=Paenibacillus aurantiacus TaxID=1936118 RepID=A0ABV5KL23_9BACL